MVLQQTEILDFLKAIDTALLPFAKDGERLDLYLIGRSALIVRYGLSLATRDVDVVTRADATALETRVFALFGKGTPNARRWGLYLEGVPGVLPPSPGGTASGPWNCPEPGKF